jgi:hypothetical protein
MPSDGDLSDMASPKPSRRNSATRSTQTCVRYRADARRLLAEARENGCGQGLDDRRLLARDGFLDWFTGAKAAAVSASSWRRYRAALTYEAECAGLPARVVERIRSAKPQPLVKPKGVRRRRPIQAGISVGELRKLRTRLSQGQGDASGRQLTLDLLYASAATGLQADEWPYARLERDGKRLVLIVASPGAERRVSLDRLTGWVVDRIRAVCTAAVETSWPTQVDAVKRRLRRMAEGRIARGIPWLSIESAIAQHALDQVQGVSTANRAAPEPGRARWMDDDYHLPDRRRYPNPDLPIPRITVRRQLMREVVDAAARAPRRPHPSPDTQREYIHEVRRLLSHREPEAVWAAVARTKRVTVLRKRRAALRWFASVYANLILSVQAPDQIYSEEAARRLALWQHLQQVMAVEPDIGALKDMMPGRVRRKSLRSVTALLPEGWQAELHSALPPEWRDAMLVQAVTGCRPAELAKGVLVVVGERHLAISIHGAKVTGKSGWHERVMLWEREQGDWDPLLERVRSGGTRRVQLDCTPGAYYHRISRAARKLWPQLRRPVAPYALRHAVASLAKVFRTPDDVAKLLGHRSPVTQALYGDRRLATGGEGLVPDSVEVYDLPALAPAAGAGEGGSTCTGTAAQQPDEAQSGLDDDFRNDGEEYVGEEGDPDPEPTDDYPVPGM